MGPLRVDRWRQDGGGTARCGCVFLGGVRGLGMCWMKLPDSKQVLKLGD